jgi:spermidine synthase
MPGAELRADLWLNESLSPWDVYSHGITRVLVHKQTPFQDMLVVETGLYGKGLILDGKWQSSLGDEFLYHESLVHPAMIAHGDPRRVLVLGGGEGATLREIYRWKNVERAVMVEIDGDVVEACRQYLPEMSQGAFEDPRTELIVGDAVRYLCECKEKFDVVISDLSDPIEDGPSFQLFTKEYFEKAKSVLTEGGTFILQSGAFTPVATRQHARLYRTQKAVFANVLSVSQHVPMYAGLWSNTLGSDRPMTNDPDPAAIDRLLADKTGGGFRLIDGAYLRAMLQTPLYMRRAIEAETGVYTLDAPLKFFGHGNAGNQ